MKKYLYCFRAGKPRPYRLSIAIFILLLVGLVVGARSSRPAYATETTVYLGGIEKTIETGEVKVYIPAGSATVVRTNNKTEYLYSDHLGSTVLATKDDDIKEDSLLYYPYGNQVGPIPPIGQISDKLYTGQRKDESSDLYFYHARYYNPKIGNFISADKAQGPNRYSYVGNNPLMRNDPTGNCFLGIIGSDCNLPSYARYATEAEKRQPISNYGLQAVFLGGAAFLADQNIPVVSGISGSYAKAADEIITGSITNDSGLYTLGGMDLMTSVAEAYTAGITVYGYASLGKSFYNYYLSPAKDRLKFETITASSNNVTDILKEIGEINPDYAKAEAIEHTIQTMQYTKSRFNVGRNSQGKLVGYAYYIPCDENTDVYLTKVHVGSEYRGKGFAEQFVKNLTQQKDINVISLHNVTVVAPEGMARIYNRLSFTQPLPDVPNYWTWHRLQQ